MPDLPYCRSFILTAVALLAGCDAKEPVLLDIPLNRFELPEVSQRPIGFSVNLQERTRLVLSPDQTQTAPDGTAPDITSGGGDNDSDDTLLNALRVGLRLDYRPASRVEFSLFKNSGGPTSGRIKIQLAGNDSGIPVRGDGSLAISAAYGEDSFEKKSNNGDFSTDIDRIARDFAIIAGMRLEKNVLLYGGPFYSDHSYDGFYQNNQGALPPNTAFDGDIRMRGGNVGLAFGGSGLFNLMVEFSRARVDAGANTEYRNSAGVAINFAFGERSTE